MLAHTSLSTCLRINCCSRNPGQIGRSILSGLWSCPSLCLPRVCLEVLSEYDWPTWPGDPTPTPVMSSLLLPQGSCFFLSGGGPCVLRKAICYLNNFFFGSSCDVTPCLGAAVYLASSLKHLTPPRHLGGDQLAPGLVC